TRPARPLLLGLTGSIGMGKTTAATLLAELGCVVHDADAAVHAFYRGEAGDLAPLLEAFPEAVQAGGQAVDRGRLAALVRETPARLAELEALVHPHVAADRDRFVAHHAVQGTDMPLVFDVPLLFESGMDALMDKVAVVSAPAEVQRQRVLARDGMTEEKFN